MKTFTSFILGAVVGGLAIFTIAADSHHPTTLEYRAVGEDVAFKSASWYNLALTKLAKTSTNGWEFVSVQIVPKLWTGGGSTPEDWNAGTVFMIQRRPAQ